MLAFIAAILQLSTGISASLLPACPTGLPLNIAFRLPGTKSCYFLSLTLMSFDEAKAVCESQNGGHLIFYETQAEQDAMELEITKNWNFLSVRYWLGLSLTGNAWHWTVWKDNLHIPVAFTDWGTSPVSGLTCATKESGGKWASTTIFSRHAVICEIDETPLLAGDVQQMQGGGCPPGLPLVDQFVLPSTQSCYFSEDKEYTISQARGLCESVSGGHLVYLESQGEMAELNSKLFELYPIIPDEHWLGMEKREGAWKWVNIREGTQKPVTWTPWLGLSPTHETLAGSEPLLNTWKGHDSSKSLWVVCEIDTQTQASVPPVAEQAVSPGSSALYRLYPGEYDIYQEVRMRSVVECASQCSRDIDCEGVHYRTNRIPECLLLSEYSGGVPGAGFDCHSNMCYVATV